MNTIEENLEKALDGDLRNSIKCKKRCEELDRLKERRSLK